MRKGILSLSLPGRGKSSGRKKTSNMEIAEQAAAKKAAVAEQKPETNEKMFVQTILVPKQQSAAEKRDSRKPGKARKRPGTGK